MSAFDLSSGAFNAAQHYSSVSTQQGRVQLDADSSEDSEANSEKIKRLTADMAAPAANLPLRDTVTPVAPGDPPQSTDVTPSTVSGVFAGFEPNGGLHPLATEFRVASSLRGHMAAA